MTRKNLLIVDDEEEMRHMLSVLLRKEGYKPDVAKDGVEALEKCEKTLFDIILCDVRMAQGGGLELLAAVRRALPAVPVLLMTAFGDADVHRRARLAGAADVLDKPVDVDLLRARVRGLVGAGA